MRALICSKLIFPKCQTQRLCSCWTQSQFSEQISQHRRRAPVLDLEMVAGLLTSCPSCCTHRDDFPHICARNKCITAQSTIFVFEHSNTVFPEIKSPFPICPVRAPGSIALSQPLGWWLHRQLQFLCAHQQLLLWSISSSGCLLCFGYIHGSHKPKEASLWKFQKSLRKLCVQMPPELLFSCPCPFRNCSLFPLETSAYYSSCSGDMVVFLK